MKKINVVLLIALILIIDQTFKIYIKTNFPLDSTRYVAGNWFQLYFVENPGMAYGWKFGGNWQGLLSNVLLAWFAESFRRRGGGIK